LVAELTQHWGVSLSTAQAWGVKWIQDHAANQKSQNKPVIIGKSLLPIPHPSIPRLTTHDLPTEEFGIMDNKLPVYTAWFDAIINSGLTGFAYWQAGSQLSNGPTHDDGFAVYPNTPVYDLIKTSAARLKSRA
jgi:mannan endo-1,4-beta-mannosidase